MGTPVDLDTILQQRIAYALLEMELISPQRDLVYKLLPERPLHCDIYHPPASLADQPNPCVIFIHGNWPQPILPIQTEGQHGFDRCDHTEASRSIIRETVTFLQRHLRPEARSRV